MVGKAPILAIMGMVTLLGALPWPAWAADDDPPAIILASTTSTENSGLFAYLLPRFTAATGITVHVVARGTGQAIRIAERGDADALLVHDRIAEDAFVAAGFATTRRDIMYNDFILVGPKADPAGLDRRGKIPAALQAIARAQAVFVSRGDNSGTHKAELRLWKLAEIDPTRFSGGWYRETGSGMGATLNVAAAMSAYTLTDRATWTAFGNKAGLAILFQGDARLRNQYGVMAVNPARHPHVKARQAAAFIDWLASPAGQGAIGDFRIGGRQVFFPNAKKP